ncbi:hypothetical protein [Streptomyces sp. NPDC093970]|uniref:hypothetical protein n=1 Tax=Streptomyces sp. NPDC093970 TaxID=3155076 RepID=UPI003419DC73
MSEKRPWHRAEFTQPPVDDFDFEAASDEGIRLYCLRRSRAYLARAEAADAATGGDRPLEIAARYAIIAEAFREDPA